MFPSKVSLTVFGCFFLLWNFPCMRKICRNFCYKFFAIISFAMLPSSCFTFHVHFRSFCSTLFTQMLPLNRYEKVKYEKCGTQTTKLNLALHKKNCSAGTLYCTQCPNSFTKSKIDLNYILLISAAPRNLMSPSSVNFVIKSFQDFTIYIDKETLNTQCKSDQEQEMWMWNT